MFENIIGVEEASSILSLSPGTIKNKCAKGEIPAKKIGNTWIMHKLTLEEWKMKKFNQLNARNSTIITFDGEELRTIQDPHVSDDNTSYKAIAVDKNDIEHEIEWEIINNETTDESEACDWNNPISVVKI